jgi:hypothetical protein
MDNSALYQSKTYYARRCRKDNWLHAYDGKEFSWQSNEKGRAVAWLAFVDVPDPLDEMT